MGSWQQRDQGLLCSCPEFSSSRSLIPCQLCGSNLARSPFLISPNNSMTASSLVSQEGGVSEPQNREIQVSVTTPPYIWTTLGKPVNISELLFPFLWNRNKNTILPSLIDCHENKVRWQMWKCPVNCKACYNSKVLSSNWVIHAPLNSILHDKEAINIKCTIEGSLRDTRHIPLPTVWITEGNR